MEVNKQQLRGMLFEGVRNLPKGKLISEPILSVFIDRYLDSCLKKQWLITGPFVQFLASEFGLPRQSVLEFFVDLTQKARTDVGVEILPPTKSFPKEALETPKPPEDLAVEFEIETKDEEDDDKLTLVDEDWERKKFGVR